MKCLLNLGLEFRLEERVTALVGSSCPVGIRNAHASGVARGGGGIPYLPPPIASLNLADTTADRCRLQTVSPMSSDGLR